MLVIVPEALPELRPCKMLAFDLYSIHSILIFFTLLSVFCWSLSGIICSAFSRKNLGAPDLTENTFYCFIFIFFTKSGSEIFLLRKTIEVDGVLTAGQQRSAEVCRGKQKSAEDGRGRQNLAEVVRSWQKSAEVDRARQKWARINILTFYQTVLRLCSLSVATEIMCC